MAAGPAPREKPLAKFSGDESVTIPCYNCGHENPVTINRLERDRDVVCCKCGKSTNFFASDRQRRIKVDDVGT